jgi:hypothetical protein
MMTVVTLCHDRYGTTLLSQSRCQYSDDVNSVSGGTDEVCCGKYDSVGEKTTNIIKIGTVDPQCFCIIIK